VVSGCSSEEIEAVTLNPFDADPTVRMAALDELRSKCPIAELQPDAVWLGLSHEVVSDGLRRVRDFAGSVGQEGLDEQDKAIAGILEPRHSQIRKIINAVVAFHKSQGINDYLEGFIDRLLDDLLDAADDAGPEGVDVMPLVADPIPPAAIARLMGFPEADSIQFYGWADQLGERFAEAASEGRSISMAEACPQGATYVADRIDQRLQTPPNQWPNDALSRFLTTEVDGRILQRREIVPQVLFLIGAGSETTRNLIGNMLYRLARDEPRFQSVRSDPSLVDAVVEEALRLDPPAQFMVRTCLAGAELGGVNIRAGGRVFLSLSSANTDPDVFADPGMFDPERSTKEHVSFGQGPHICPGAALARLEARITLRHLVQRVERMELGTDYHFEPHSTGMLHGPRRLLLSLTRSR
jgi:cytochrome P450